MINSGFRTRQMLAGLGVDPALLEGPTTNATATVGLNRFWYEPPLPATKAEYVRVNLDAEMRRHRGNKRIRKKRAKKALALRWAFLLFARPISKRLDYAAIGRTLFSVEPLPQGALPIYDKDPDVTSIIIGTDEHEGDEG